MTSTLFPSFAEEHHYRTRTQTNKALAGVTAPSFMCGGCKTPKTTLGRKKVGPNYRCRQCVEAIQAKKEAPGMDVSFYSLGMLITGRISPAKEALPLNAMDLLAQAIADEEQAPHPLVAYVYGDQK